LERFVRWASENDERATLTILLVCVAMGAVVLTVVAAIAIWLLPPTVWNF